MTQPPSGSLERRRTDRVRSRRVTADWLARLGHGSRFGPEGSLVYSEAPEALTEVAARAPGK